MGESGPVEIANSNDSHCLIFKISVVFSFVLYTVLLADIESETLAILQKLVKRKRTGRA